MTLAGPAEPAGGGPVSFRLRPATEDELAACASIWREAINDYLVPLNQPPVPDDLTAITRLYRHTRATDPDRFVVAVTSGGDPGAAEELAGFVSAVQRERVWFLSMLFVRPPYQHAGLGRTLLGQVLPPAERDLHLATATDSLQPISNALYAAHGIPPRTSLYYLIGRPQRPGFPPLPGGVVATPFEELVAAPGGHEALVQGVDELDREVLGYTHPADHAWLRREGRQGILYHGPDGAVLGYGYAAPSGRTGPVATRDPALLAAILGHLLAAVQPNGASAVWIPGPAGPAMTAAIQAGLRIESFPVLLCWSRAFADFERYLPISPGLL